MGQLSREREQVELATFQEYEGKIHEINAALERIGFFTHSLAHFFLVEFAVVLTSISLSLWTDKLEGTLAEFLRTIENVYQTVFPDME